MIRSVRVGSLVWKVKESDLTAFGDLKDYGITVVSELTIYIHSVMPDELKREVLFHEILHAIWWTAGIDKMGYDEERTVGTLSPWIRSLFKDNPKVAEYIHGGPP